MEESLLETFELVKVDWIYSTKLLFCLFIDFAGLLIGTNFFSIADISRTNKVYEVINYNLVLKRIKLTNGGKWTLSNSFKIPANKEL